MLSDRSYMSSSYNPVHSEKNIVYILIAINTLAFLLIPQRSNVWLYDLAFSSYGIQSLKLWQFVSYMFLHANFTHIFFNMWGLYLFGMAVLPIMGTTRFLQLYLLSGVSGAGLWLLVNWGSRYPLVGASAAIFGVMMAAAMFYPEMRIQLIFPPIPMKMKTFVLVYAGIEIASELSGGGRGIAHLAHLGGFISAYIYLKALYGHQVWDMFGGVSNWLRRMKPSKPSAPRSTASKLPDGWQVYSNQQSSPMSVTKEEIDQILDKISASGMGSLTPDELAKLKRASGDMRQ